MEKPSSSTKKQRLNENGPFDQVAQASAYAYAPSSSTQPKSRCAVFINHRGPDVKRTLGESIRYTLSMKGVQAFLDEKDLQEGDPIPTEIQEAMDNASLHIAIFSKRYAQSPWCLAELSYILTTGVTIIPIFYNVDPSHLRWVDKGIYADSFSQHKKKGRYTVEKLREWKQALQTVSNIKGYELKEDDWRGVLEGLANRVVTKVSKAQVAGPANALGLEEERPLVLRPSQGKYPDAVGVDKARDHVIGLLDLQDHSTKKIVVVYGVGGIGKTTLATAVFNTLDLTGHKHCRVDIEQNCSVSDIKSLQEQILKDLFNINVKLRNCREGREQLSEAFKKESTRPLFMFIDNALRRSDLATLLPKGEDLSCLPVQSRMLITTRKLDETNILLHPHIQRCAYAVEPLPRLEAKQLLCKIVLGSVDENFDTEIDIDGLVECCGGIPLVLEIVGSNLLSDGSEVSHWVNFLKETLQEGEGELSESVVDCVYNSLQDSYKEAFLDVASFFHNTARDFVAKIVGEVEMKGLEDTTLVKTSGRFNIVSMHDIVRARGKWLSKSNRITDMESLKPVLRDPQKLQQLKGIMIGKGNLIEEWEKIEIQAEHLDLTRETLRILQVSKDLGVKVKGRCKGPFKNLRFLNLRNSENNTCFSMRLNNLKRLAVCYGNSLSMNVDDCRIAESLRVLVLENSSTLPDSLGYLSSLEKLELRICTFVRLPHSLGQLRSLRHLSLDSCPELSILPESLGNLSSLEKLYLDTCTKLEGLPQSVSQLSFLEKLSMEDCERLSRLPDKFGELKSLKYLNVRNCRSLRNLGEDFGRLTSLTQMNASQCSGLGEKEMDTLFELKSLMFLNIEGSAMLMARWKQTEEHHPLLVYSTVEERGFWQRLFGKMMSRDFFHPGRKLMQLDGGGNLVEWIPSSSFVVGQARVGVLFTMCDLCAPSNSEGLQTVKEKCTELLRQDFHIIYVEVGGLGELSQQSEEHIRQALLSLPPGTIAWIASYGNASLFFAYCAYKALKNGFNDKKRALFCNEHQHVELTLALDALNTFLIEVKPVDSQQSEHSVDDFDRLPPGRSEQTEYAVEGFDRLPPTHSEQVEHSIEGMYFGEGFHRLFSPFEDVRPTVRWESLGWTTLYM